ncbi:MAG TPA: hypothetical protein PLU96_00020 [Methanofastidiosum sp.]|nr:hypothetical protein [Methanofastidiosum sp.]HPX24828.1 hypothetical protein [Methanofastidiosum sp.]HQC24757.1 hypothetical protein [Methanofastidiosum sp.]HQF89058.1 hypothetical protein [Methanofastidiosum sp.]HQG60459.1 hypothetical protein [Methanofastidiosum sp.]
MLKIAIPKKARLSNSSLDIMKRSDYASVGIDRKLFPRIKENKLR